MMKKINFLNHCFVEQKEYHLSNLLIDIPNRAYKLGFCLSDDRLLKFNFTGIAILEGVPLIVFPKGYDIPNNKKLLQRHIILLIKVLSIYKTKKSTSSIEDVLFDGLGENYENISSAIWLLQDYENNGYIDFHETKYISNIGSSVNWSRTINSKSPIISNQNLIYLDLVTKKRSINSNHIVTLIHAYAVDESIKKIGWLFDLVHDEVLEEVELPFDNKMAEHLLEIEINHTFIDHRVTLLENLKEFIRGSNENNVTEDVIHATRNFEFVWEDICQTVLSYDIKRDDLPKPYWSVNNFIKKTTQIPDIICKNNEFTFIIDAKYYSVEFAPKKLPGWSDLVKQYFYSLTYKDNLLHGIEEKVENIFIFPAYISNNIEYLGFASIEGTEKYGKIYGYQLNLIKALENYLQQNRGVFIKELEHLHKNTINLSNSTS